MELVGFISIASIAVTVSYFNGIEKIHYKKYFLTDYIFQAYIQFL